MNLSRRALLFGIGATVVAVAASSPLFPAPTLQPVLRDLRVGDTFTIGGVLDPVTGRLQKFRVTEIANGTTAKLGAV